MQLWLGAVLAAALGVGVASAHVSVTPARVPPNSSQTFTLRVPTEREAPTIRLRVEFPTELTVSRFQPKPGWTREIERDSANRIIAATWSGGKIAPGEFDDFVFTARTPAAAGKLLVKAYQSYEGGDDSCKIPGSVNFCHDLIIPEDKGQQRIRTMLFTRRYGDDQLSATFEKLGFEPEDIQHVKDSKGRPLVAHYLFRRAPDTSARGRSSS